MVVKLISLAGVVTTILVVLAACSSSTKSPDELPPSSLPEARTTMSSTASSEQTDPARIGTPSDSEQTSSNSIPPGSIALFATISGGTQSEFLKVEGANVNWDSTHYTFLRYIPEIKVLDEFGWTTSKSYAKSYIYGITAGDWVYVVRCSTDTGAKDITRLDPWTGETVGRFSSIVTDDIYGGFTISGDRLIYRTKISKDLLGKRRSGGDVMAMEIGSDRALKLLDYADADNTGQYHAFGEELVTIVTSYEDARGITKNYDIYRVDPGTLAISELLYTFKSGDIIRFHGGATALYWSHLDPDSGDTHIVRFPSSGEPPYYLTISETTSQLLTIDESQGKVLIVFRDDTTESPSYYLVDLATNDLTELDIDRSFFSNSVYGNGQFCILE